MKSFKKYLALNPQEILGYICVILSSNIYRTKFNEFLRIDFAKIIFVDSVNLFEKLSKLGMNLINAQLFRNVIDLDKSVGVHISKVNEKCIVEKVEYLKDKKELIYSDNCKFINVPFKVYEFSIGTYRVLKNYLRLRKGRELNNDEIAHLENVIRVINYTFDIQEQIDLIICNLQEFSSNDDLSSLSLVS